MESSHVEELNPGARLECAAAVSHVVDTHLAKLDDQVRVLRRRSLEAGGSTVSAVLTAFGVPVAVIHAQLPLGETNVCRARLWVETSSLRPTSVR